MTRHFIRAPHDQVLAECQLPATVFYSEALQAIAARELLTKACSRGGSFILEIQEHADGTVSLALTPAFDAGEIFASAPSGSWTLDDLIPPAPLPGELPVRPSL